MSIILLQKRKQRGTQPIKPGCVQVTISHSEKEKKRDGRPYIYLRCVFGANIPYAEYYTIGKEGSGFLLVPVGEEDGFKTGKTTNAGRGVVRINLADETIGLLPMEWQNILQKGKDVELNASFDYEGKKVIFNGIQN